MAPAAAAQQQQQQQQAVFYQHQMMMQHGQRIAPRTLPPFVFGPNYSSSGWSGAAAPPDRALSTDALSAGSPKADTSSSEADGDGPPQQQGRRPRGADKPRHACAFFLKTGSCAYGDRCKFEHPYDRAPRVDYNSLGLPMRPQEPTCSYYVKNYQ
jgi:hypothetical protein